MAFCLAFALLAVRLENTRTVLGRDNEANIALHAAEDERNLARIAQLDYATCQSRATSRDALRAFIREAIVTVWARSGEFTQEQIDAKVAYYLDGPTPAIPIIVCTFGSGSGSG